MPVSPNESKVSYPGMSLNEDVAKAFLADADVKLGDTITAKVTFKVVGLREDQYGHSVSLDATSMDDIEGGSGDGAEAGMGGTGEDDANEGLPGKKDPVDADADEEKILGYKRPKANPKLETPDTSAKSILD